MARFIYSYRVAHGPEGVSWVFRSLDPLPLHVTLAAIQYFAINARRQFSCWWVAGDRHGVSTDATHAAKAATRWSKACGCSVFFGRIAHESDLEETTEPRLPAEGEDLSDA